MIKSFSWRSGLVALVFFCSLWSCQKREDAVATPQTITDRILEDSQFSLLRTAVVYAGMGDALKGGNLTLFAPNDAAFQASGISSGAAILAMPREQVRTLILYHVLSGQVAASVIPAGLNAVQTASQGTAFFNKASDGTIYVNNARIAQADVAVANGYIHVINKVLNPSTGTLLTTIQSNSNLTFLAAAIRRISAANPSLVSTLSETTSTGAVTLFAPNDAAFRADGTYNTMAAIESANVQSLTNVLLYHVVSGALFSNQIQTGSLPTLLNNNRVTVAVTTNQFIVRGTKNSVAANVTQADLPATNGVMHIVDKVLLP